jgi:hypothetical protein
LVKPNPTGFLCLPSVFLKYSFLTDNHHKLSQQTKSRMAQFKWSSSFILDEWGCGMSGEPSFQSWTSVLQRIRTCIEVDLTLRELVLVLAHKLWAFVLSVNSAYVLVCTVDWNLEL